MQSCPICGKPLRALERVEARHTPASVPEHAKGYSITHRYTIVRCERQHQLMIHDDGTVIGGGHPLVWQYD